MLLWSSYVKPWSGRYYLELSTDVSQKFTSHQHNINVSVSRRFLLCMTAEHLLVSQENRQSGIHFEKFEHKRLVYKNVILELCNQSQTCSKVNKGKSKVRYCSSWKRTSLLWEITCLMESHSVTCHSAEVTFPPLPQPKLVLDLVAQEGCLSDCYKLASIHQSSKCWVVWVLRAVC